MDSNSTPPPPSSQSRPRVPSNKPRSICRNFVYHGVCRDTTCPRAHVPHSDMLDLVTYLTERNDFPPELHSVKQRLTPPNPVSISRGWFFAALTIGIESVQEAAPVRSNMPQFCSPPLSAAREMLAHAFLSRQHLRFFAAACKGIPSPVHCSSSDGFSCNSPSAPNHTKLTQPLNSNRMPAVLERRSFGV
ncbi:hypothetical protein EDB85DRAFT_1930079 [Lactarius pseudohatsudake]|nr:hypothetical protein EDB85DRAFT_1930079 [Lactarius pseudohatsudake]